LASHRDTDPDDPSLWRALLGMLLETVGYAAVVALAALAAALIGM
jgi:hypothetical protein